MFVFSFGIFEQRQGFGFSELFRRAGETQEGGAAAGEQVKPEIGPREGR